MPVMLRTNNLWANNGIKPMLEIRANGNATPNDTITLVTATKTLVFTCAATPNDTGNQYRPYQAPDTQAQYLDKIAADLSQNYWLITNYEVLRGVNNFGNQFIRLIARSADSIYNFTSFTATSNRFIFINTNGATRQRRPNFNIGLQVWAKLPNTEKLLGEDSITPDDSGNATFDIANYLASEIKTGFTYPVIPTAAKTYLRNSHTVRYFFRFFEKFGTAPTQQEVTSTSTNLPYYAYHGRIEDTEFRYRYIRNVVNWLTFRPNFHATLQWLTRQPRIKYVKPWYVERLFFLCQTTTNQITFRLRVTRLDNVVVTTNIGSFTQPTGNVYEVACGYNELGLNTLYPNGVKQWEISVWRFSLFGSVQIAPTRTFIPSPDTNMFERQFIFKNKLGAYDCFVAKGLQESEIKYERNTFDLEETAANPFKLRSSDAMPTNPTLTINAHTGHLTKQQRNWLTDFTESTEIYEILNNKLYKITLISDSIKYAADREGTFGLAFTYEREVAETTFGGVGDMSIGFKFIIQ